MPASPLHRLLPAALAVATAVAVVAAPATAADAPAPAFLAARAYPVAVIPKFVDVADMTHDGLPDIVSGSQGGDVNVSVNLGSRSFNVTRPVNVLGSNADLGSGALADLNGDGFVDVVVQTSSPAFRGSTLTTVLNEHGTGLAEGPSRSVAEYVVSVAAGDVTGDGLADVVAAWTARSGDAVAVLRNTGDGSFADPVLFPVNAADGPIRLADLNGDGTLDAVVVGANEGTVTVLLGDGDGGFGSPHDYPTGRQYAYSLAIGDVTGDDTRDIVIGGSDSAASVLPNLGDGMFGRPSSLAFGAHAGSVRVAVGDVDGDGLDDVIASVSGGWTTVRFGDGSGGFGIGGKVVMGYPDDVAAADLDVDGLADAVVADNGGAIVPVFSRGTSFFGAPLKSTQRLAAEGTATVAADFDGDGLPDLAIGAGSLARSARASRADVSIFLDRDGRDFAQVSEAGLPETPTAIAAGDFDEDGAVDLVLSLATNDVDNVVVLLGNGDGTFRPQPTMSVSDFPVDVTTSDFDGDGHLDIALAVYNTGRGLAQVAVLPGAGDGTFGPAQVTTLSEGRPGTIVAGDFDGDGATDVGMLVIATDPSLDDNTAVALGTGTGSFQHVRLYHIGTGDGDLALAHLDRNSTVDLVAITYYSRRVVSLLGRGDGRFVERSGPLDVRFSDSIVAGDFDAIGGDDVVVTANFGPLSSLHGNGDGTFGPPVEYAALHGPIVAGDFDGDGHLDVVETPSSSTAIVLFEAAPRT